MRCRHLVILSVALLCSVGSVFAQSVDVWVGTTTPRNGDSKGIYHLRFDSAKGKLSKATLAAEIGSPGFLAIDTKSKRLYSTGSVDGIACAASFAIDGGKLTLLNSQPIGDGGAAHVSVNSEARFLLTAQYGGCLLYTSPSPRDQRGSRMPSSA